MEILGDGAGRAVLARLVVAAGSEYLYHLLVGRTDASHFRPVVSGELLGSQLFETGYPYDLNELTTGLGEKDQNSISLLTAGSLCLNINL
jgi:hypothetical protein